MPVETLHWHERPGLTLGFAMPGSVAQSSGAFGWMLIGPELALCQERLKLISAQARLFVPDQGFGTPQVVRPQDSLLSHLESPATKRRSAHKCTESARALSRARISAVQ